MMRVRSIALAAFAAGGVLALGIWLGGQRASAQRHAPAAADETPTAVERPGQPSRNRAPRAMTRPTLARPATPGLAEDLRDPDPQVRRNAVAELATSSDADSRALIEASRDTDLGVAFAATQGLATLYRDGRVPASELVARLGADTPDKVRVAAINGLGVVPSADSARALLDVLARGGDVDRRSAAIVLQHQDPAIAVPALIGGLSDRDEVVRANARESLTNLARGRDLGSDPGAWQRWWQARAR